MIRASAGTAGCCQTPGVPHEFGDGDVSVASVTSEKLDCWGPDSIYLQDVPPIPHFNLSRTSTQAKCQSPELCMESAPNLLICHHLVTRCHTSSLKEPCIYNIYIYKFNGTFAHISTRAHHWIWNSYSQGSQRPPRLRAIIGTLCTEAIPQTKLKETYGDTWRHSIHY
jgi:hypothetical protein